MSTLTITPKITASPAHAWFEQHLPELQSRARVFVRRLPPGRRQDAKAEILAQIWRYVLSASRRGKLALLTPFTLISFFGRSYVAGRRFCGASSGDALSEAGQVRHGFRVLSIQQHRVVRTRDGFARLPLSEILADRRVPDPQEDCRRDLDYPSILVRQKASRRARQLFARLAASHGAARGVDLARELHVSPPRIVQLKHELARHLAAEGYGPERPLQPCHERPLHRGRPRRLAPPLNAGTSPAGRGVRRRCRCHGAAPTGYSRVRCSTAEVAHAGT